MSNIWLLSVGFGLLTMGLTMLWRRYAGQSVLAMSIVALLISIVFNFVLIYVMIPSFTHPLRGGYPLLLALSFVLSLLCSRHKSEWSILGGASFVLTVLCWFLITYVMISPGVMCDNEGADQMAAMLEIQFERDSTPSDTSPDTLLRVTPKTAHLKASRAISSEHNLGAYLELNKTTLQQVNGEWGYVVDFSVHSRTGFRASGGVVPGYIWVNAEDPFAEAELRLGYDMQYVEDALFNQNLERHIYLNHQLEHGWQIDDLTLEIDDEGTPYYTASLLEHTIGWNGQEVVGAMTIDPETGEIKDYMLGDETVPAWIDRIYSLDWVEKYTGWWARHHEYDMCQFKGTAGQKKIDRVNDVIREEGLVYQVTLTSVGADQSLTDIVYVNPRSGQATRYPLSGSTLEGVEALISEAAYHRFTPEECELHQIIGEPSWYCVLNGKGGSNSSSGSYAGVAFVQARYSSEYTKVIRSETLRGGYDQLKRQIIAEHPDRAELVDEVPLSFEWQGILERKAAWRDGFLLSIVGAPPDSDDEPTMRWFVVSGGSDQAALAIIGDEIWVEANIVEGTIHHEVTGIWNVTYPPPKE